MKRNPPEYTKSSGNVFADLGLPNADELLAKAMLVVQIASVIHARHLTQAQTAELLDTTQPNISALLAGKLDGFSMERLIRFLNALDQDVRIAVSAKHRGHDRGTVWVTDALNSVVDGQEETDAFVHAAAQRTLKKVEC